MDSTITEAPATASPLLLDWDAPAKEIDAVSVNVNQLEQKSHLLWDDQPAPTTGGNASSELIP